MTTPTHTSPTAEKEPDVPASVARTQHSLWSAVRTGFTVWYALLGSIAAWIIHLIFLASFVRYTCNVPSTKWVLHAVTAVTLAMTVLAMVLAWRLDRTDGDEGSDRNGGPLRFVGRLALVIGASNFALIALEELYVIVLAPKRCG
jgi:uncharacterized ion transporter superfamily protein YfcC